MGHDIIFLKSTCDIGDHPLTAQLIFCGAEHHYLLRFPRQKQKKRKRKKKKNNKQETSQLRKREKDVRQNITASLGNCRTESEMIYL